MFTKRQAKSRLIGHRIDGNRHCACLLHGGSALSLPRCSLKAVFEKRTGVPMPTLFRFIFVLAAIAAIIYGSMVSLVALVQPREREVTVRIPSERLNPPSP